MNSLTITSRTSDKTLKLISTAKASLCEQKTETVLSTLMTGSEYGEVLKRFEQVKTLDQKTLTFLKDKYLERGLAVNLQNPISGSEFEKLESDLTMALENELTLNYYVRNGARFLKLKIDRDFRPMCATATLLIVQNAVTKSDELLLDRLENLETEINTSLTTLGSDSFTIQGHDFKMLMALSTLPFDEAVRKIIDWRLA